MRASARRPARVLAVVAVLAVAGGVLALRLEPSAAMDTLVGRGADSYQATETYRERFGDHSVIVLARGDLPKLVLTSNLGRLVGLEGCLSGNKPEGQAAPGGARLAVRPAGADQAGAGRLRPGHLHQRGGRRDQRPDPGPDAHEGGRGGAGGARRAAGRARPGQAARRAEAARRVGAPARLRAVRPRPAPDQPALRARPHPAAEHRRPRVRLRAGLRRHARRRARRRRASPTCSRPRSRR